MRAYTVLHLNNLPYYYEILPLNNFLHLFSWRRTCYLLLAIVTVRKQSLRRLCFHRSCVSTGGGGCLPHCMLRYTHPPGQAPSLQADTPPCAVHAGIWSTSGQYASHWNAFLLLIKILTSIGYRFLWCLIFLLFFKQPTLRNSLESRVI